MSMAVLVTMRGRDVYYSSAFVESKKTVAELDSLTLRGTWKRRIEGEVEEQRGGARAWLGLVAGAESDCRRSLVDTVASLEKQYDLRGDQSPVIRIAKMVWIIRMRKIK
jgi:hypothetical protein